MSRRGVFQCDAGGFYRGGDGKRSGCTDVSVMSEWIAEPAELDFFVSYTAADRAWAEWIAWELEDSGFRVLLQAWDFVSGSSWVSMMHRGVQLAKKTVVVLSDSYLSSAFGAAEWQAAWRADPEAGGKEAASSSSRRLPTPRPFGGHSQY
jgi:hypothetical protein